MRNPNDNPSLADILNTDTQNFPSTFSAADWYTIPQRKGVKNRWVVLRDRLITPKMIDTQWQNTNDHVIIDMSAKCRFQQSYTDNLTTSAALIQNQLRIYLVSNTNTGGVVSYTQIQLAGKFFFSDDTK